MPYIATIISVIFAIFYSITGLTRDLESNVLVGILFLTLGSLLIFVQMLIVSSALSPMQTSNQMISPRVILLFKKDRHMKWVIALITFLALISYVFAFDVFSFQFFNKKSLLIIWLIVTGISLDGLNYYSRRILGYLDPFNVITLISREANVNIQNNQERDLCNSIDSLAEIGINALNRHSTAVCDDAADELQKIARIFFESQKSISHIEDKENVELQGTDKVSYTLFFILQRIAILNDTALQLKMESPSSSLITVVGKIMVSAAKYDLSMTSYPLYFLGKMSVKAQQNGFTEVGQKAICTLLEVAKVIINEIDVTYLELQETFFTLIAQLNEISKELFRQNKAMSMQILKQPFLDLKQLFSEPKMASHQDTGVILQELDRTLAEYQALEAVMKTIPPIPKAS